MAYTQDKRLAVCTTPLGKDALFVTRFDGQEGISRLFEYRVQFASPTPDHEFAKLIGKPVAIEVAFGEGDPRHFNGICARFAQGSQDERLCYYQAVVVPDLWLLTRRRNCRIFPEKSVPEILKTILGEHKITNVDYRFKAADYLPWTYCVQYQETDFDFISRLLEEEGIFYWFKHEKDKHTLVFGDIPNHHDDCAQSKIRYRGKTGTAHNVFWMTEWSKTQELRSGKYAMTDYNFFDPSTKLLVNAATTVEIGANDRFELFDYPGRFVNVGHETEGKLEKGERWVKIRMQEEAARSIESEGKSESRHVMPGYKFELVEHYNDKFNGKYLVVGVRHRFDQSAEFIAGSGGNAKYENELQCIPFATPYRPPRSTRKPVMQGPQTAVVVGPEEIQIDDHGRVKVLFHWDREGSKESSGSCWIRVAKHWAGKSWGTQFHPRVGQEVVVEFLQGDPDQPIIVGSVYNAEQTVYLPSPTQSGVMTRSSPDGTPDNFNELRFEDEMGREEIYLHAEKDWNVEIERDESKHVGGSRTEKVDVDVTIEIKGNRTEKVTGDRSLTVEGSKSESISGVKTISVTKDHTEDVRGGMSLTIDKDRKVSVTGKLDEEVGEKMTVSIDKDLSTTVGKSETLTVGENRTISVKQTNKLDVKEGYKLTAKEILIEAKETITLKAGSSSIILKKGGDIVIDGKNVDLKTSSNIGLKASGDIAMKGAKMKQN